MDVTQILAGPALGHLAPRSPREGDLGFGKIFADMAEDDPVAAEEARVQAGQRAADLYALQELEASYAFALERYEAFRADLENLTAPYFGTSAQPLSFSQAVHVVDQAIQLLPLVHMSEDALVGAQTALVAQAAAFEARHALQAPLSVQPVEVNRIFSADAKTIGDLVGQWLEHLGDAYRVDALEAEASTGDGSWPNLAILERAAEQVLGAR